ncbi:unnamed protein product [Ceutorhynchus assimilis]|uniref:Uncharacterized protein n=1 Tax=Ceutorhynchus assimilis TaxID=467358 RepID=A0A9N9MTW8_9CUCU|nr:unnamed protein product [Ceutorhynchus assimilis]
MSLPLLLITIAALIAQALSATLPVPKESAETPTENVETFDSYAVRNLPEQLPLRIQLPREEPPSVPFYADQPEQYLRAPQLVANPQPNFYQVPVPSEYLTAPTEGAWNPNDDPTLYYELPASITRENIPTNEYPKKYNKDVHGKSKPLSLVPKHEIELEPINESQYIQKQKELYKTIQQLNKKQNLKDVAQEKVPVRYTKKPIITKTRPKDTQTTKLPKIVRTTTTSRPVEIDDPTNSETIFGQNINTESEHRDPNTFTKGLSPEITNSLGLSSNPGDKNDRVLFHMVGHDGPMSYKWGYDTGKGHNRQFRFEERDKEGIVKGQYGYYDKEGKFRMMNYNAHPDHGFHSEPAPESEFKE